MSHVATVREVLRPRRSTLPLFLTVALFWTLLLASESMGPCLVAVICPDRVGRALELVLGIGLPLTYLLAAVSMATLDEVADPVGRFPALFAPPRAVRNALLVIATFAGVSLFLGALGALYLEVSVWLLVLLDAPVIGFLTLHRFLTEAIARPNRLGPAAELALYLVAAVVQVGWWYVLAYGAARLWSKWTART